MIHLNDVIFLTGAWDLKSFLTNAAETLKEWGDLAAIIIGLVCIFIAIWRIASGLWSHGQKQTNWAIAIILLLVGGTLAVPGGFKFFSDISEGGKQTITDLGGGAIMLFEYTKFYFLK